VGLVREKPAYVFETKEGLVRICGNFDRTWYGEIIFLLGGLAWEDIASLRSAVIRLPRGVGLKGLFAKTAKRLGDTLSATKPS